MTYSSEVVVLIAGVVALILAALSVTGFRAAQQQGVVPPLPYSQDTQRLFNLPQLFVPVFFGLISVVFPTALTSTALGAALCVGMAIYFALQGWAYLRSPEMRQAGPYIGTYLAFSASTCYVIGALAGDVI